MKPSTSTKVIARRGSSALDIPGALSHGAHGLLASPAGSVSCDLEALGVAVTGARYELRVTNGTSAPVTATAYAVRQHGQRPSAAVAVEVDPHALVRTGFTLDAKLAYERVLAEVRGEGIHLIVEAAPPRGGDARRRYTAGFLALGGALALAGATLLVVAVQRPHVVDAALAASTGGELVARWQTTGEGTRNYELRNVGGTVIAHGALPGASGTMTLGRGSAATLRVAIANAFGKDARDAVYARATPPPAIRIAAAAAPHIISLAVEPGSADEPMTVRYTSDQARALNLTIVDRTGATWFATTVASGHGAVRLPPPPAGPRAPFALIATAQGTGAASQTRVPIPVGASPSPSPSPGAIAGDPDGVASGDQLIVTPDVVTPGARVTVALPPSDGARVAIVREADGAEVAGFDVAPGTQSVSLTVPSVGRGPYSVRATMTRGAGTMTLLHQLTLARGH